MYVFGVDAGILQLCGDAAYQRGFAAPRAALDDEQSPAVVCIGKLIEF